MKKRAIISVSDKKGIVKFAKKLVDLGWEIISTGGTRKVLNKAGIKTVSVEKITGNPEAFSGRMKTISYKIASALLFSRSNPKHIKEAKALGIKPIDMVVSSLYPFTEVIKGEISEEEAIENIDIGGPTMIRAAAKNYKYVTVVTDKKDYNLVLDELKKYGKVRETIRRKLTLKVFKLMSFYDGAIYNYFSQRWGKEPEIQIKPTKLRYGENPHQKGVFFPIESKDKLAIPHFKILQGKELSFNNILDINASLDVISKIGKEKPATVVIKHGNPCGAALAKDSKEAFKKAWEGDLLSAFGSVVCVNRMVDRDLAKTMTKNFFEVLLAPEITKEAESIFSQKPNIRVLVNPTLKKPNLAKSKDLKFVRGVLLVQDAASKEIKEKDLKFVTKKKPSKSQVNDLLFAFKICEASKSNSVTIAKNEQVVGNGIGTTARVYAAKQALEVAGKRAKGAVAASDGFFPFVDSLKLFKKYGISAIIQPGGSKADKEVIDFCNKNNLAMVFTGIRGFKH